MTFNLKKIALFLFALNVILVSSFVVGIPQASAVNTSDNAWHYTHQRTHVTDRFDKAMICGNHYCTPGEYMKWDYGVYGSQGMSSGKISGFQHGEHVMQKLTGSNPSSTTMHGNSK
jgi:hypothetical protein